MARHSFIQIQKLSDVAGRINYISSHERQENLYATYQTAKPDFWKALAKESQQEFQKSGSRGNCIEARELIIALPEQYLEYDPQEVLERFTNDFKNRHKVECASALHHNNKMTNYHIHLIFSERQLLESPEVKRASRNMFYNESGKRVRTKKEILDESGAVKFGCYIVPKGEIYKQQLFSAKNAYFKDKEFLRKEKRKYTELINQCIDNLEKKLQVFHSGGLYLPTKKIGKNNPRKAEIEADNKVRQEWNHSVDRALVAGITEMQIGQVKEGEITQKVKDSIKQNGNRPGLFRRIVDTAILRIKMLIERLAVPPKPILTVDLAEYRSMQHIMRQLKERASAIQQIENRTLPDLECQLKNTKGFLKGKERKAIQSKILETEERLVNINQSLSIIVRGAGFRDVQDFMRIYSQMEDEVKRYKVALDRYQKHSGEKEPDKESIRERLQKIKAESRLRNEGIKKQKIYKRGAR
ncbi:MAG: MobA/MobL family protein [Lachnospiraceae bacterium]